MFEGMKGMNQNGKAWQGRAIAEKSRFTLLMNPGSMLKNPYWLLALLEARRCSTHIPITILHEVFV